MKMSRKFQNKSRNSKKIQDISVRPTHHPPVRPSRTLYIQTPDQPSSRRPLVGTSSRSTAPCGSYPCSMGSKASIQQLWACLRACWVWLAYNHVILAEVTAAEVTAADVTAAEVMAAEVTATAGRGGVGTRLRNTKPAPGSRQQGSRQQLWGGEPKSSGVNRQPKSRQQKSR